MRPIAGAIVLISMVVFSYAAYAFVFYAWLTATPLEPAQLPRTQSIANLWLGLAIVSLAISIGGLLLMLAHWRE